MFGRRGIATALYLDFVTPAITICEFVLGRSQAKEEEQPVVALVPLSLYVRLALFLRFNLFLEVERYLMAAQGRAEPAFTRLTRTGSP